MESTQVLMDSDEMMNESMDSAVSFCICPTLTDLLSVDKPAYNTRLDPIRTTVSPAVLTELPDSSERVERLPSGVEQVE